MRDQLQEITGLGISFGTEHAHEALWRFVSKAAQLFKTDRGIDVIAQNSLTGLELSGEKTFDAFAQKLVTKSGIALDTGLDRLLKIAR